MGHRFGTSAMDHPHRFDVLLAHEVDVSKAAQFLLHQQAATKENEIRAGLAALT